MTSRDAEMREAFENWMRDEGHHDFGQFDGRYQDLAVHDHWKTWVQASNTRAQQAEAVAAGWVSQSSLDAMKRDSANVANLYAFKPSPRNRKSDHVPVFTNPQPQVDGDRMDAERYRFLMGTNDVRIEEAAGFFRVVGQLSWHESKDKAIDAAMGGSGERV